MDELDPEHNIDLIIDEWGTWYDVEPGTNPGFLYQQNTMRDAIVAALNLNIFNKHSDMISMANIAQVVNVLQAMVLTEGIRSLRRQLMMCLLCIKNIRVPVLCKVRLIRCR